MKYINLLCNAFELQCLFPDAKLLDEKFIKKEHNFLLIKTDTDVIEINHYFENIFDKIENINNIFEIDSYYINPIENLTIVCDRQLWYRFYLNLLKNNKEEFNKLEKIYVEKNVKIIFNFAILEAVNYEDEEEWFLYDFKFKHIKLSDYELFDGKKNFYYDSFYNLYHILAEPMMCKVLFPNMFKDLSQYHIDFKEFFENININPLLNRDKIYSHSCLKPRYHRIKFLLECYKNDLLSFGKNNVNIKFLEEYKRATFNNKIHTDGTYKHSKNHLDYFNKNLYEEFLKITNKINITMDDSDFIYNHMKHYFLNEEYNESYIEVVGETHCIFDLKYGFFTEKSIKPVLSEKFVMIYGSNKVYKEYKRIGIELFLNELGIYDIEEKNELEQIDRIVNFLKKCDKEYLKKLYIEKYDILKNNKKILFDYYCKIMNKINVIFLEDKK